MFVCVCPNLYWFLLPNSMCEHMSIYFIEHTMSKRIFHYLFYKIIANRALKKKNLQKAIPNMMKLNLNCNSTNKWQKVQILWRNYHQCHLLILGCSLGLWHNPESPEGSGCIPAAHDHPHGQLYCPESPLHRTGSCFGCQPHRWHNPHLNIWEQPHRLRPWRISPCSPAPDRVPQNPTRTL